MWKASLTTISAVALVLGAVIGVLLNQRVLREPLSEASFTAEAERGTHMRIIWDGKSLRSYATSAQLASLLERPTINADSDATYIVPDDKAAAFFGCQHLSDTGHVWFDGDLGGKEELFLTGTVSQPSDGHIGAFFQATGSLYLCMPDPKGIHRQTLARGVQLRGNLHRKQLSDTIAWRQAAWGSYFGFAGEVYVTFLLMLFVPTLALSLFRAMMGSWGGSGHFKRATLFFVASSLVAAVVGTGVGWFGTRLLPSANQFDAVAEGLAPREAPALHEPHPILTQLERIIPENPLAAFTNPSANIGLQVAFIVILLGFVLSSLDEDNRRKVLNVTDKALGAFSSTGATTRSLSNLADALMPVGVLAISATVCATLDTAAVIRLSGLCGVIVLALLAQALILLLWVAFRRDFADWWRNVLWPSLPGLSVAAITSSSYAALSRLHDAPAITKDEEKRAIFDLGTTLNKNGTATYLASAGAFLAITNGWDLSLFMKIVMVSAFAGAAVAGLPLAAVFGLQMVLALSPTSQPGLAWLIIPIDMVADRFATTVNVFGNLAVLSKPRDDADWWLPFRRAERNGGD